MAAASTGLRAAVDKLGADTQRTRSEGLDDLRRLLSFGRDETNVPGDEGSHSIFEALYRLVRVEKAAFLKATKAVSKNTASSRLSAAASALRLAVEATSSRIRFKTTTSVLDHIVGTLPIADDSICEPLMVDYLKSFRILLDNPSYGEHLRPKQWQSFVDFIVACISSISAGESNNDGSASGQDMSFTSSHTTNHLSIRTSQGAGLRTSNSADDSALEELMQALKALTSVTNAPVSSRCIAIVEIAVGHLSKATRALEVALETINNVAVTLLTNDIAFAHRLFVTLIPTLRRLWLGKSQAIRDQILVTLSLCQTFFITAPESPYSFPPLLSEQLLATLLAEYNGRTARNPRLHTEEIVLQQSTDVDALETVTYSPVQDSPQAISNWYVLMIMAHLVSGLSANTPKGKNGEDHPRKRHKSQKPTSDLFDAARGADIKEKVTAIQVLFFFYEMRTDPPISVTEEMPSLIALLSDDDGQVASWAMFLYSRYAVSTASHTNHSIMFWQQVWDAARRMINVSGTTRAACRLLDSIVCTNVLGTSWQFGSLQSSIFHNGTTGPSYISDAALLLFTHVLQSDQVSADLEFESFALKIIAWLRVSWILPSVSDKTQNVQTAFHVQPEVIVPLIFALRGLPLNFNIVCAKSINHPVGRAEAIISPSRAFLNYFCAIPQPRLHRTWQPAKSPSNQVDQETRKTIEQAVLSTLTSKVGEFKAAWKTVSAERASGINLDIVTIVSTLCTCVHTAQAVCFINNTAYFALSKLTDDLWTTMIIHIETDESDMFRKMLAVVASRLQQLCDNSFPENHAIAQSTCGLISSLLPLLRRSLEPDDPDGVVDDDMNDSSDTRRSQGVFTNPKQIQTLVHRHELEDDHFYSNTTISQLLDLTLRFQVAKGKGVIDTAAASTFIADVVQFEPALVLAARSVILRFLNIGSQITRKDANQLLERLAEVCLVDNDYERCESALCCCLDVMSALVSLWTIPEVEDDLSATALDMYSWYLNTALGKGIASSKVLLKLSALLDAIIPLNVTFADDSLPSPRTSILRILQVIQPSCKYQLSSPLSRLFDRYVLSEHAAIFNDILDNLPSDADKAEGIAARFHIVAELGSQWHTIRRHATYTLFETAAYVPGLAALAKSCVDRLSEKLGLETPRHLFADYAPQILYTWLAAGNVDDIPYAAFSYTTLKDFLSDNKIEIAAQISLRGATQKASRMAELLGVPWENILDEAFPRAEAYCLASEISLPQAERLSVGSESQLRKQFGNENYLRKLRETFPAILAALLISLEDDSGIERALEKSHLTDALKAFQSVCRRSTPALPLPPAQQPSFRAKFLLDEIQYLCSRINLEPDKIWDSALLVYLYRSLLQSIVPNVGPLHACMVVRKIRIVTSLGCQSAITGYPLEMLLHNLRPYLTNFHCSEVAIGLFWYLLESGKGYLSSRPSFLAGISVIIFVSLTDFVNSPQDSTTQESYFRSTISQAQAFRSWLGTFLTNLKLNGIAAGTEQIFKNLVVSAHAIGSTVTSSKHSPEGVLLLNLLQDNISNSPLLTESYFELTIKLLNKNFEQVYDLQEDILADGQDAVHLLPVLQRLARQTYLKEDFRVWLGTAVGRAVAKNGFHSPTSRPSERRSLSSPTDLTSSSSYDSILKTMVDMLWKDDNSAASCAERTLQSIVSTLDSSEFSSITTVEDEARMLNELKFKTLSCPMLNQGFNTDKLVEGSGMAVQDLTSDIWATQLVVELCSQRRVDPILGALHTLVTTSAESATAILPFVVHLNLLAELDKKPVMRTHVSEMFSHALRTPDQLGESRVELVIRTILYLRRCQLPNELNVGQRDLWLDIDFAEAAMAAGQIRSWLAALLFLEIQQSQMSIQSSRSSRRSSSNHDSLSRELLSEVFQNVDDQDFFYGTHEDIDMSSVVQRLTHEDAGSKTVSFQSALLDASLRSNISNSEIGSTASATAKALNTANLHTISQAVRAFTASATRAGHDREGSLFSSNSKQWRVADFDSVEIASADTYGDLKILASVSDRPTLDVSIHNAVLRSINSFCAPVSTREHQEKYQLQLASLAEVHRFSRQRGIQDLEVLFNNITIADKWMKMESFEKIAPHLERREKLLGYLRTNENLRSLLSITTPEALLLEAKCVRHSLSIAQHHGVTQFSLNKATYLSHLSGIAKLYGVRIEAAALYDLATTFWAQNELSASIRILQAIRDREDLQDQNIHVIRSEVLTNLGQKVAEARLEKPDEIITNYLIPAYKELKNQTTGSKAGLVFHNFAAFCDMQLQDNDNHDDFTRIAKIRERKLLEVRDLEKMMKGSEGKQREQLKMHYAKAKTWFKLDDEEWQRVQVNRETLILRCLENYLLSMIACDDFPNDTLRLLSLWLDRAHSSKANASVHKYIGSVPTRKFAPLMNQLSSRILNTKDDFQQLLIDLVFRICCDHPYHSLYQVFATSKSKGAQSDEVAASRFAAANKLADLVRMKGTSASIWISIHNTSIAFVRVAQEKITDKALKTGSKILIKQLRDGTKLISTLEGSSTKIPPPTMKIALRADKDYSLIPTMIEFDQQISIAGGVSAPKIATAIASDGSRHKMLLKGGNDDLRQDSIMEQVFEQVSDLLQDHRPTRQRKLGIRTYKVVPLYPNAGIIEFVQNTIPLHDYLLPAHTRYFPKDYKPNRCRKEISDAQTKPLQQRIQAYRTVTSNFHPVMRFFFMDRFFDPDEWFQKRLNYSRSTAAISILGHVLGLGDRHGHNILLDTTSGEVVHIDLGVAFEAGRVLPVPEVVPFRLTRDLVDGMGISGVEGVFRRCCNFTLEALRHEQEAIMTILDVLRYDPLYSWSVSPLRLQKMQENMEQAAAAAAAASTSNANVKSEPATTSTRSSRRESGPFKDAAGAYGPAVQEALVDEEAMLLNQGRKDLGEPNEADRALTVVAKKLSKSLSVEATVNELIRQATDERNLAVLYCGWAAYA